MSVVTTGPTPVSYKDAGVDVEAADHFVGSLSSLMQSTHTAGVVQHASRYAALFRPDLKGLEDPLIAATCDGVGTKLLVAREVGEYEGLGQDLVAMNVNDLLPLGARPLLFLDYLATGKLDPEPLEAIVRGVSQACREVGCALLGGETAEMPGLYPDGDFDLAGFAVGLVDGAKLPDPAQVRAGDRVLALPSSGLHSNGYSLARKVLLEVAALPLDQIPEGLDRKLGAELLTPTRLYVREVLALLAEVPVSAMAHVTGGGLLGRAAGLVPDPLGLRLDPDAYERPALLDLIAKHGHVPQEELARTFNMGLGYLAVVPADEAARVAKLFPGTWLEVGEVVAASAEGPRVDLGYARG